MKQLALIAAMAVLLSVTTNRANAAGPPKLAWRTSLCTMDRVVLGAMSDGKVVVLSPHYGEGPEPFARTAFFVLDVSSGKELWNSEMAYQPYYGVGEGKIFISRTYSHPSRPTSRIETLSLTNGQQAADSYHLQTTRDGNWWESGYMFASGGRLFYVDQNGDAAAADTSTMQNLWHSEEVEFYGAKRKMVPVAAIDDDVYLSFGMSTAWAVADARTGKIERKGPITDIEATGLFVMSPVWSPRYRLMFVPWMTVGVGLNSYAIEAMTRDMKQVWRGQYYGEFVLVGNALITESWKDQSGYERAGLIALDPATGKQIWLKSSGALAESHLVGTFGENAVVLVKNTPRRKFRSRVIGVRPSDGKEMWSVPVPDDAEVKAYGDWLLVCSARSAKGGTVTAYRVR